VFFTLVNAVAFVGMGIYSSVTGITNALNGELHTGVYPGLMLLESLDLFIVAVVFIVFALGIAKLFEVFPSSTTKEIVPEWLNIKNFTGLKMILWETILTTLIVLFVSDVVRKDGNLDWKDLVIPVAILLMSASMVVIKRAENK
jgi:uncharacterized membrane protein YqhA